MKLKIRWLPETAQRPNAYRITMPYGLRFEYLISTKGNIQVMSECCSKYLRSSSTDWDLIICSHCEQEFPMISEQISWVTEWDGSCPLNLVAATEDRLNVLEAAMEQLLIRDLILLVRAQDLYRHRSFIDARLHSLLLTRRARALVKVK